MTTNYETTNCKAMPGVNTRELALLMLIEINEKGQFSHIVLNQVLDKYQYLSKTDRAFMTRLVDGTLERMIELDYIIDLFSKTKTKKMKPFIRNLLRMSVYQIKYMDSVPASAACNEAVKLVKKHKFVQLSGFVNGVLRNIARSIETIECDDLSVKYSMPQWIVDSFVESYGVENTIAILESFQKNSSISIRTNLSRTTADELFQILQSEGVRVERIKDIEYAFIISGFDYLNGLESFKKGLFYVQDISSMLVAREAAPQKDCYVIDVCAAPGGKSTHIAELMRDTGMVDARDLTEYKVSLIEENIKRQGLTNIKAAVMDATVFDENSVEKADILVCDLPCSGLGVLGRKKDIRYKINQDSIKELQKLQRKILDTVHTYVKPGGTLIYSTCTINRGENEDNVSWFLDNYPEFEEVKESRQIFPGEIGNDGFFIAKLRRRNNLC